VVTPITAVNSTFNSYFVQNHKSWCRRRFWLCLTSIERAHCNTGVTAQDVRALSRSDDWWALHSRNKQLVFFYEFVKTEYNRLLTSEVLGQAFGIESSQVRKIRSKAETSLSARRTQWRSHKGNCSFHWKRPRYTELRCPERRSQFYPDELPEMSELLMDGFVFEETCEYDLLIGRSSPRECETRSPSWVFRPAHQVDQRICTIGPDRVVV
jgi:hypothetical protein